MDAMTLPFGLYLAETLSNLPVDTQGRTTGGTEPPLPPNEDEGSDDVFSQQALSLLLM